MAEALGVKFSNSAGGSVLKGGGALGEISKIDMSGILADVLDSEIHVACDVDNPLCGPEGASAVYGPQKGADPEMVQKLDRNLEHFSGLISAQLGKEVGLIPGSGAAGGLGAGLIAFLDATLMKGFDMVADMAGLEEHIKEADLVITGEGKIDSQTRFGKTPYGVALLAKKYQKPVIAVGGKIESGAELLYDFGIHALYPISDGPISLEDSISRAGELLERTGERIARTLALGKGRR
jgi:glycerate kinase